MYTPKNTTKLYHMKKFEEKIEDIFAIPLLLIYPILNTD